MSIHCLSCFYHCWIEHHPVFHQTKTLPNIHINIPYIVWNVMYASCMQTARKTFSFFGTKHVCHMPNPAPHTVVTALPKRMTCWWKIMTTVNGRLPMMMGEEFWRFGSSVEGREIPNPEGKENNREKEQRNLHCRQRRFLHVSTANNDLLLFSCLSQSLILSLLPRLSFSYLLSQ